jgi:hypothetical protein
MPWLVYPRERPGTHCTQQYSTWIFSTLHTHYTIYYLQAHIFHMLSWMHSTQDIKNSLEECGTGGKLWSSAVSSLAQINSNILQRKTDHTWCGGLHRRDNSYEAASYKTSVLMDLNEMGCKNWRQTELKQNHIQWRWWQWWTVGFSCKTLSVLTTILL